MNLIDGIFTVHFIILIVEKESDTAFLLFYSQLLNQNAEFIESVAVSALDENDPMVSSTGCHACASTSDDVSIHFSSRISFWKK